MFSERPWPISSTKTVRTPHRNADDPCSPIAILPLGSSKGVMCKPFLLRSSVSEEKTKVRLDVCSFRIDYSIRDYSIRAQRPWSGHRSESRRSDNRMRSASQDCHIHERKKNVRPTEIDGYFRFIRTHVGSDRIGRDGEFYFSWSTFKRIFLVYVYTRERRKRTSDDCKSVNDIDF